MVQSTPLNTETLPLNSHLTVTSALSAKQLDDATTTQFSQTPSVKISWNDCNDNLPRRRTRHGTIPAQTCHRINGRTLNPGGFREAVLSAPISFFCYKIDCFSLPPLSSYLKVFSLEELRAALPACCRAPPSLSVLFCLSRSSRRS